MPSATARVSAVVPIVPGIIAAFGIPRASRRAALLMVGSAQVCSVMNIGVLTAAAPNATFPGLVGRTLGATVTWTEWLVAAAPFWLLMTPLLFLILWRFHRPEVERLEGGRALVRRELAALGPMSGREWRTLAAGLVLLLLWGSEGRLHPLDTASTTILAVAVPLLPGLGVISRKEAQAAVPWGTLVLFAVGIALGAVLVQTRGAAWLAARIVEAFGLAHARPFETVAVMAAFPIVVHLGFASATALAAAFIPIVIAVLQQVALAGVPANVLGVAMILQLAASFGFMLVVNAPQNMVAYGTGAFRGRDFTRSGAVVTAAGYLLLLAAACGTGSATCARRRRAERGRRGAGRHGSSASRRSTSARHGASGGASASRARQAARALSTRPARASASPARKRSRGSRGASASARASQRRAASVSPRSSSTSARSPASPGSKRAASARVHASAAAAGRPRVRSALPSST
ncbi:anion permease [Caldovatus sp. SYSU G05006]|uniref:Anion permease n=1 Tax=Caldovatus aquaticus TaxID=2865671 RepID=A0ABS7F3Y3_9PROT|nr:anion permease [Caldovatus aquaticus]